jgi:hypothetical protein
MVKIPGEPFDQVARARKSTFHRVSRCKRQPPHQRIEPERQAIAAKRRMRAAFHSAEDPEHATANGLLVLYGLNEGKNGPIVSILLDMGVKYIFGASWSLF